MVLKFLPLGNHLFHFGVKVTDGPASLAPDILSTVLWATIFLMFVFGIWEKAPIGSYEK